MDAGTIILGFTGSIGSGCSYISRFIPKIASKYKYFKLSEIIRDELKKDGIESPTITQLQDKGNELRGDNRSGGHLVGLLLKRLKNRKYNYVIIDGIKNTGEVKTLRQFPYFYLFSIQASTENRKSRVVGDGKPFKNDDEFTVADERDRLEKDDNNGQELSAL
jgi:dephospho-CoA kinase